MRSLEWPPARCLGPHATGMWEAGTEASTSARGMKTQESKRALLSASRQQEPEEAGRSAGHSCGEGSIHKGDWQGTLPQLPSATP